MVETIREANQNIDPASAEAQNATKWDTLRTPESGGQPAEKSFTDLTRESLRSDEGVDEYITNIEAEYDKRIGSAKETYQKDKSEALQNLRTSLEGAKESFNEAKSEREKRIVELESLITEKRQQIIDRRAAFDEKLGELQQTYLDGEATAEEQYLVDISASNQKAQQDLEQLQQDYGDQAAVKEEQLEINRQNLDEENQKIIDKLVEDNAIGRHLTEEQKQALAANLAAALAPIGEMDQENKDTSQEKQENANARIERAVSEIKQDLLEQPKGSPIKRLFRSFWRKDTNNSFDLQAVNREIATEYAPEDAEDEIDAKIIDIRRERSDNLFDARLKRARSINQFAEDYEKEREPLWEEYQKDDAALQSELARLEAELESERGALETLNKGRLSQFFETVSTNLKSYFGNLVDASAAYRESVDSAKTVAGELLDTGSNILSDEVSALQESLDSAREAESNNRQKEAESWADGQIAKNPGLANLRNELIKSKKANLDSAGSPADSDSEVIESVLRSNQERASKLETAKNKILGSKKVKVLIRGFWFRLPTAA